jgi:hypothetical protein
MVAAVEALIPGSGGADYPVGDVDPHGAARALHIT